ncbi:glycosyltransferase [Pseudoclavibacter sp. Z016]|uniref:glycosyltransferase n=1 Tax=Pseudoclavibacter sp. Z016 TaxID=2080581 RepID=UPI000CE7387A|nr:hypothetical protein [Pseudoclavibacter sp. Z016]PPF77611.1 hypothetical protein C5B99_03290 [Pseudoclavibacter sp. Z016]
MNDGNWHFYCEDPEVASVARHWRPDEDPEKFASGFGHNILELFARFRDRGYDVTLGPDVPGGTSLVVAFISDFVNLRTALVLSGFPCLMIRSDSALHFDAPFRPDRVIVPNRSAYWIQRYGADAEYLPALPQRGLIPRDQTRTVFEAITLKCNPEHVPKVLLEPDMVAGIVASGFSLHIDSPSTTNGSDQTWHDFSNADLTLCIRGSMVDNADVRKPPTKLINAWNARTVPIISGEASYLELASPGEDSLLINDARELPATLARLRAEPEAFERIRLGAARRADEYSLVKLVDEWAALCGRVERQRIGSLERWQRVLRILTVKISNRLQRRRSASTSK